MLHALPYDYSYLDDDAEDEKVEGVVRNDGRFIGFAGDQQSTGRK